MWPPLAAGVYRGNPFVIEAALAYGGVSAATRVTLEGLAEMLSESDARNQCLECLQTINVNEVPVQRKKGAEIRVYSGSSTGLQSGTRNHVPVTMVEINLEPQASAELDIATSYNGFAFVIDGCVRIGDTELNTGQVGWLDC